MRPPQVPSASPMQTASPEQSFALTANADPSSQEKATPAMQPGRALLLLGLWVPLAKTTQTATLEQSALAQIRPFRLMVNAYLTAATQLTTASQQAARQITISA